MKKLLNRFDLDLSWQGVEVMGGDWNDESYIGYFRPELHRQTPKLKFIPLSGITVESTRIWAIDEIQIQ